MSVSSALDVDRWDQNAPERFLELATGSDLSYLALIELIETRVRNYVSVMDSCRILDVGCGVGFLSRTLAELGNDVVAIDESRRSIELAQTLPEPTSGNIEFLPCSLERYSGDARNTSQNKRFDIVVANMTLHCVRKLPSFMENVAKVLSPSSILIATIPNPDTYLQSRPDIDTVGLDLRVDQVLNDVPFRIHGRPPHPSSVTYYHHPFRTYFEVGYAAKLNIRDLQLPEQIGKGKPRDIALLEYSNVGS